MTEENEMLKLQTSMYHEDFDKEKLEKEQERGRQAELEREKLSLTEQVLYKNLVCCLQQDVPGVAQNVRLFDLVKQKRVRKTTTAISLE